MPDITEAIRRLRGLPPAQEETEETKRRRKNLSWLASMRPAEKPEMSTDYPAGFTPRGYIQPPIRQVTKKDTNFSEDYVGYYPGEEERTTPLQDIWREAWLNPLRWMSKEEQQRILAESAVGKFKEPEDNQPLTMQPYTKDIGSKVVPDVKAPSSRWETSDPGAEAISELAWMLIPGGLYRHTAELPLRTLGKIAPKAVSELAASKVGRVTGRLADTLIGKRSTSLPPLANLAEQLGKTEIVKDIARSEAGFAGKQPISDIWNKMTVDEQGQISKALAGKKWVELKPAQRSTLNEKLGALTSQEPFKMPKRDIEFVQEQLMDLQTQLYKVSDDIAKAKDPAVVAKLAKKGNDLAARQRTLRARLPSTAEAIEVPSLENVPQTITQGMRKEMLARGLDDEVIGRMTSAEAHEFLMKPKAPEVAKPAEEPLTKLTEEQIARLKEAGFKVEGQSKPPEVPIEPVKMVEKPVVEAPKPKTVAEIRAEAKVTSAVAKKSVKGSTTAGFKATIYRGIPEKGKEGFQVSAYGTAPEGYWSTDLKTAEYYAAFNEGKGTIRAAQVELKKPFVLKEDSPAFAAMQKKFKGASPDALMNYVKDKGYDGLVIANKDGTYEVIPYIKKSLVTPKTPKSTTKAPATAPSNVEPAQSVTPTTPDGVAQTEPAMQKGLPASNTIQAEGVAKELGIKYEGTQKDLGDKPVFELFTDPQTGTTIATPINASKVVVEKALNQSRLKFLKSGEPVPTQQFIRPMYLKELESLPYYQSKRVEGIINASGDAGELVASLKADGITDPDTIKLATQVFLKNAANPPPPPIEPPPTTLGLNPEDMDNEIIQFAKDIFNPKNKKTQELINQAIADEQRRRLESFNDVVTKLEAEGGITKESLAGLRAEFLGGSIKTPSLTLGRVITPEFRNLLYSKIIKALPDAKERTHALKALDRLLDLGRLPDVERTTSGGTSEKALRKAFARMPEVLDYLLKSQKKLKDVVEDVRMQGEFKSVTISQFISDQGATQVPLLPERTIKAIQEIEKTLGEKVSDNIANWLNIPRSIKSSMDLSAPFRQGAYMMTHPKEFFGGFKPMFKAFADEDFAQKELWDIMHRPTAAFSRKVGLDITTISDRPAGKQLYTAARTKLSELEEPFQSVIADQFKIFGKRPIRASNRAYVTFLNRVRADVFDNTLASMKQLGMNPEGNLADLHQAEILAKYINIATGRGSLGKKVNAYMPLANALLFSPRFQLSRLELPLMIPRALRSDVSPFLRKMILRDAAAFYGATSTILGLAVWAGQGKVTVETDPRSTDFGKMKIGNMRIDPWAGMQPWARFLSQVILGQRKSSTGRVQRIDRTELTTQFLRTKAAPIPGLAGSIIAGKNVIGEHVGFDEPGTVIRETLGLFSPLAINDVREAIQKEGLVTGAAAGTYTMFGGGIQTYESALQAVSEIRTAETTYGMVQKDARDALYAGNIDKVRRMMRAYPDAQLVFNEELISQYQADNPGMAFTRDVVNEALRSKSLSFTSSISRDLKELEEIRSMIVRSFPPTFMENVKQIATGKEDEAIDIINKEMIKLAKLALLALDELKTGKTQSSSGGSGIIPAPTSTKPVSNDAIKRLMGR